MQRDVESLAAGVERGGAHADVEGEPGHVEVGDLAGAQHLGQAADLEGRVALVVGRLPRVEDHVDLRPVEAGVELGAGRPLDAVRRPRAALAIERPMVGRMPVARGHDERGLGGQLGHERDDLVAALHGQRAAGAEVVLEVDDEQRVHRSSVVSTAWTTSSSACGPA